jgi:Zn-dependent peptidase ImmA (M78 family)/DNA-binding XRE family transcriptional regulator
MNEVNPTRLKFARKKRGLTIKELSAHLETTTKTVSEYENGRSIPTEMKIASISRILAFPRDFFYLDDILELSEQSVSFRSLARASAKVKGTAICAGQIALELNRWLESRFELPKAELPNLNNYTPNGAAEAIRDMWALGEKPIKKLIYLLEAKGIRFFSLQENTLDLDAFSFWYNEVPFIFLNTKKSVERTRFDIAHELGHLVLHKHGQPSGKEIEKEATAFASAFLMPEGSVVARAPRYPSLDAIFRLKAFWIVSAAALVRRLFDLEKITEWQYRSLMINLSKGGNLKQEPYGYTQKETSKLLNMVLQSLRVDGITVADLAKNISVNIRDVESLLFNLSIIAISGRNKANVQAPKLPPTNLTNVK